jgi:hypothetical protein
MTTTRSTSVQKFKSVIAASGDTVSKAEIQKALKSKGAPKTKAKPITITPQMTQMEAYEKAMEAYLTGSGKK